MRTISVPAPRLLLPMLLLAAMFVLAWCGRSALLKGQSNSHITFCGLAVDEVGAPLAGANLTMEVEAIPSDWTFETRGKPHVFSTVNVTSGADGRFHPQITGHILRIKEANRSGYRHLFDLDQGSGEPGENMFYQLDAWSTPWYKSDPEHPAIFVFVKDGVQEVSALPCKGGWDSGGGKQWRLNRPGWPRKPSLDDVDWKGGQPRKNVEMPLVFKVMDTEGRPVPHFSLFPEVERYRSLQEMRSSHYDPHARTAKQRLETLTDASGMARVNANGFRLLEMRVPWDARVLAPIGQNYYAREFMDNQGTVIYRCDDSNPMVLVVVPSGATESHAMPCRGGYELYGGQWHRVEPAWPENPNPQIVYPDAATTRQVAR